MNNSHKTAITRNKISGPSKYLKEKGFLQGTVLDYGCGRGFDADALGMDKYDPHYFPHFQAPVGGYDVVICNYVLNVIEDPDERAAVECLVQANTKPGGICFIAVRNDKRLLKGKTKTGTWQGDVTPGKEWELIKTTPQFRLYMYCKPVISKMIARWLGKQWGLQELFSREDVEYLVFHATGRRHRIVEIQQLSYDLDLLKKQAETDVRLKLWLFDHCDQELVAKLSVDDDPGDEDPELGWDFELVIYSNGGIKWMNRGEVQLTIRNPLPCYERILRRLRPEIFV